MKKEKTIKTHTRKTKSGKTVQVKQHTAKYDASDMAKDYLKSKKGAGEELSKMEGLKDKEATNIPSTGISPEEYKAWYHWDAQADPKNPAALKVEKTLKSKMGAKGYKDYFNKMTEGYSPRGHTKEYKSLGIETPETPTKTPKETLTKKATVGKMTPEKPSGSKVTGAKASTNLINASNETKTKKPVVAKATSEKPKSKTGTTKSMKPKK